MKGFSGVGLVVIGFLFLYMAVTGKLDCLFSFVACVTGSAQPGAATNASNPTSGNTGVTGISYSNGSVTGSGKIGGVPITGSFNLPIIDFGGHGNAAI